MVCFDVIFIVGFADCVLKMLSLLGLLCAVLHILGVYCEGNISARNMRKALGKELEASYLP